MENGQKPELSANKLKILRNNAEQAKQQRCAEASRRRLSNIISTKMKTSFIGALAAFEENFGFLWGYGLTEDRLTDEQKQLRELWDKTRTQVLNNGNSQLRACDNEISNHMVQWNRYHMDLKVLPENK